MKAAVLDGVPDVTSIVAVFFCDTKHVHFLSIFCNAIKWIHKTRQVYDPETQMVRDGHLLHLNVNYSYYYNIYLVNISN